MKYIIYPQDQLGQLTLKSQMKNEHPQDQTYPTMIKIITKECNVLNQYEI